LKPHILVIDDEPDICSTVRGILEDEGYVVSVAENGESAKNIIRSTSPDLILLDIWMPDIDGISLLKEFTNEIAINVPVIMMSGHGTIETAVEATRLGAKDFIEKPLSLAKLLHTVQNVLSESSQEAPVETHQTAITPVPPIGKSVQLQLLREHLERLAQHDSTVLLHGEPGSGKTFSAKYLHAKSSRKKGPFIDVHTSLFRDGQGIALLLGQENNGRIIPGFIEQAEGGTLFLDDVAELNKDVQQSLFAVLSTGQWVRVNGTSPQKINTRIVSATRYDLKKEVTAGRFREDLYHLLNTVPMNVPPLREHIEDISELLQYYVNQLVDHENLPYRTFTVAAQNRLRNYGWPGNIRELENLVRRLLVLGLDSEIEPDEVEAAINTVSLSSNNIIMSEFDLPLRQAREQFEKAYLEYQLQLANGNVGKAAKAAGVERTHLYRKLRALGIDSRQTVREK
jgi:two-component system nitrogen regulation response regulator NtrX